MGDAFEALADIRRWVCKTLDASDAGKLCGMLSEVSRHVNELEVENEQLRLLVVDIYAINYPSAVGLDNTCIASNKYDPCERCESVYGEMPCDDLKDPYNELCKPVQAVLLVERMRELGIEVDG